MKTKNFMVMGSILMLTVFSVHNVSADSSAAPISAPFMKLDTNTQLADVVNIRLENMTGQLGLSAEQQTEIRPILLDEEAKRLDIIASATQTFDERRANLQQLRDATDSIIRPLLTAVQQNMHDAFLNALPERRK
jgi:hypothetical protein